MKFNVNSKIKSNTNPNTSVFKRKPFSYVQLEVVGFDFSFDFVFEVAVAFDLHPLLTTPIVLYRKWIKKALLFEPQASFNAFPFFVMHNWAPEGRWLCGRLLLLTFLGGARKVSGCRAAPGLLTINQP